MKKKLLIYLSLAILTSMQMIKAQTPTITITNLDTFAIQGMANQPVLKMNINTGTADNLTLESLVIKSLCQDSTDIDSVAVYYTGKNNRFSFADYSSDIVSLLAKRKKFHKDSVTFNNLTFNLDTGTNYFWVVLDLSKTSKAGHYLNTSIRSGGITINSLFYPATEQLPTKQITIWQKYFTENFEKANTNGTPYGWTIRYYDSGKVNWLLHQGGYGTNDNVPGTGNPSAAKSGKTNARFAVGDIYWHSSMLSHIKPIDLTLAVKPLLVFYHAQMYNPLIAGGKQDTMSIYYQSLPDTTWRYLKGYQLATPDDGTWVKRQIVLPDAIIGKNVNLGFRGYANYGWGVCVDSVVIFETLSANRSINSIEITQPNTNFAPQSSTDNPILRVNFRVKGNTNSVTLNSFTVTSGNTSDAGDVANVKLYYTNDSVFMSPVLVGNGTFSSGKVTFSGLTRNLETGENYYWITYDVKSNANPGNILDASISTNDIVTNEGTFPSTNQSPSGNRIIKQTIFWDDFENDKGWGLKGDFQRAAPLGKGGTMGYPDPTKAYSGSMVIGNDLTGDGLYATGLTYATADTATSPLIMAKYFKNVHFSFYRWLNVFGMDSASIDIKYAGSNNWVTFWNNDRTTIVESSWNLDSIPYTKSLFDRKNFRIRYRLGPTNIYQYTGWNIDNVFFTGDSVKWDAAVTNYLGPNSSCGLTNSEHFKVTVKNTGPKTLTNIPIKLSIDGGNTWTTETIPGPISVDNTLDYTFTTPKDLSKAKIYDVIIKTAYPGDNYPDNDSITYSLTSVPTYTLPYQNGFEKDTSFWTANGLNSSWAQGAPGGSYINFAPEGTQCWQTNWSGYFLPYENSYVESPCFNITGDSIPIMDFRSSYVTSAKIDGTKIEYSLDGGNTWTYLSKIANPYSWSWYNDTIHAFHGLYGWTGQSQNNGTQYWEQDRRIVSEIANKNNVRFRFNFKSDSSTVFRTDGFAFDVFRVMNAPFDVGVTTIDNLTDGANYCQYEKDGTVQVKVKNFGIRNMHANDTIIIGVKVDNQAAVIDTFKLTSSLDANATQGFTMKKRVNIVAVGTHKIKAYTMIEKDPHFYSAANNDADSININIKQNPITNLPDTVYSASPDTVQIKAYQGTNYTYSWEYSGSTVSTTYSVNVKNGAQVRTGDFHLTVTDNTPGNGCITYDTVNFKLLKSDVGISKILEPVTICGYSTTFKPTVRIKNFGTDTVRSGMVIPVKTRLTKGAVTGTLVSDSYTLINKLAPGDSITVTLNNMVDLSVADFYTFMAGTALSNDIEYSNDSTVNSFQIYGYPTMDLGPDVYKKQLSYTLHAPAGYTQYLWNDGSDKDSLVVTTSGKYKVTVTNSNLCQTSDSINVMLAIHDLAIKRVISPLSFCTKSGLSTISVKLMNNGSDTIKTTENPVMSYSLNSGTPVTESLSLAGNLNPGDSLTYTFTSKEDIHLPGTYNFWIKATVANDMRRENDSVLNVVKVFSNPVIDLGKDNIVHALDYKLTPGSNYSAYVWQDNSTDSTYTITQTHKSSDNTYDVTVTDVNGCTDRDTVHIYFYVDDLALDSIDIPNQVCSQPFPVKIKVKNT
ncbi:MAG TPA: BNR-repeat neuraminidase N-terminal domain-containing protein, partial [Bacteroidales bacterium]